MEDFNSIPIQQEGFTCQHGGGIPIYVKVVDKRSNYIIGTMDLCPSCESELPKYIETPYNLKLSLSRVRFKFLDKKHTYHNKDKVAGVTAKEHLVRGAVEVYGEGSDVYVPDNYVANVYEYVWTKCGVHGDIFQTTPSMLVYSKNKSCPSCHKDMGLTAWSLEEWQEVTDVNYGEGEYEVLSVDIKDRTIEVLHNSCGLSYKPFLSSFHNQGKGCGYCMAGLIYSQEHLDHKLESLGQTNRILFEDYHNRDEKGRIKASCTSCGCEYSILPPNIKNLDQSCTGCSENKKNMENMEDVPDNVVWCVGEDLYKCTEHSYVFSKNSRSEIKCNMCPPERVVDTQTMRYVLTNLYGDRYDYTTSVFNGKMGKIEVYCKNHERYFQTPYSSHRKGQANCPLCAAENSGWGKSGFYNKEIPSNLYIVKLGDDHIKVGVSNDPKHRWSRLSSESGLCVEPICTWSGLANELWVVEWQCHKYSGIKKDDSLGKGFKGHTEIYPSSEFKNLLEFLEERLGDNYVEY